MKQLLIAAVTIVCLAFPAFAVSKEGPCKLKKSQAFDESDAVKVEVGTGIKGVCKFYVTDFFDAEIIDAGIQLTNTTNKPRYCYYNVAFFDKDDQLVGCASQGTSGDGLGAGKTMISGSLLIPLPKGLYEKVVKYKIAFYESDKEIGK